MEGFKTHSKGIGYIAMLYCVLISVTAPTAQSQERFEFYTGVRGLGMGGAQVATVNDETALLINPAGLGKLRDMFITIIDPELEVGSDSSGIIGTDYFKLNQPQEVLNKMNENLGQYLHYKSQVFPSLVLPNFGIGFYGRGQVNAQVDEAQTNFRYDYTNDMAIVVGYNFRLFDGRLKIGFNGRFTNRTEVHQDIDPTSTNLELEPLASEGFGIASDVGMIISMPWKYLPTLAAVYRDAGNTSYTVNEGFIFDTATRPAVTEASLDVGLAIFPIIGKRSRATVTVEYRDALNYSDHTDKRKQLHTGLEFNFADAVFVRGGMNQRYWTAGLEFALLNYQLQAATYGEEIGTTAATQEDRRYVFKFAFRF